MAEATETAEQTEEARPGGAEAGSAAAQRRLRDILLSTLIVGGGSVVTVLTGVVRGKVISMKVGPAGIGLQGLLQSTLRTAGAIAGMGLNTSGVREVARLRGDGDTAELGHTLRALRLGTLLLGGLAALVLLVFQRPLAAWLLDDRKLGWTLGVAGVGVLAQVVYSAYDAFLRGFRRVKLITKTSVAANIVATGVAIVLVVLLGDDGIVWAVVSQPLCVLAAIAIVGRDFSAHLVPPDRGRTRQALGRIIRMGVVLALTSFMTTGTQLAARVVMTRSTSLDDVGYFQAAWAVSVLYLGFVLGAMGLDYYPRLAEVGSNRAALKQMVNEQAKISFLLAGPAVLGLLTLSAQVIGLLYTSKFAASVELLRWQLLGDVLKIGSWTLGYLVLAQGKPRVFFFTELSWNLAFLIALTALLPVLGINAAAAAYVIASAVYFSVLCVVSNRMAGFSWSKSNILMMVTIAALSAVVMASHLLLSGWRDLLVGLSVTGVFGVFCLWRLVHVAGFSRLLRRGKPPAGE